MFDRYATDELVIWEAASEQGLEFAAIDRDWFRLTSPAWTATSHATSRTSRALAVLHHEI
jgi:hypothetical protein